MPGTFEAGFTVVRMIIEVLLRSNALNQSNFGAYGVLLRTGAATIDAILDLYDYYLHQNWTNRANIPSDPAQSYRQRYDIRSARRVRGEQRSLDFIMTNNAASAGNVIWAVSARMLLKGS